MKNLNLYAEKILQIELFKNNHAQIFKELEEMEVELVELEIATKAEIKEKGEDDVSDNGLVRAVVIERWNKKYNYNKFDKIATPEEFNNLKESNGIITEIDKKIFESLIKENLISQKTRKECFEEELLSVAVSLKKVNKN